MGKLVYVSLTIPNEYKDEITQITSNIQNYLSTQNITFNPLNFEDLHMTLAFIGQPQSLKNKDMSSKLRLLVDKHSDEFSINSQFEFDKYDLFPETKKNLIVARFILPKTTLSKVIELKKNVLNLNLLNENNESFVAHITLGKILSKDKYDFKWEVLLNNTPNLSTLTPIGCHLCGLN